MIGPIEVGSRVCRKAVKDGKVVGTVVSLRGSYARVKWDCALTGTTRLGGVGSQSSRLKVSSLIPESEFVRREIGKPPEDSWKPEAVRVDIDDDGGGVCIYGTNAWWAGPEKEGELLEMARKFASEGKRVKVCRREEASIVPARCHRPRVFSRWVTIFQS